MTFNKADILRPTAFQYFCLPTFQTAYNCVQCKITVIQGTIAVMHSAGSCRFLVGLICQLQLLCHHFMKIISKAIPLLRCRHCVSRYLVTDAAGHPVSPNVKGQAVEVDGMDNLPRTVCNKLQTTPYNNPEERRSQLHRTVILKSRGRILIQVFSKSSISYSVF